MLHLAAISLVLLAPLRSATSNTALPSDPADDTQQALKKLQKKLPKLIQESSFSPVASEDSKEALLPHTRLLRTDVIGKTKAIIVIGEFGMGSKKPDGVIILYCKYYNGSFHVFKHEETMYYQSGEPHDKLVKLIALVGTP